VRFSETAGASVEWRVKKRLKRPVMDETACGVKRAEKRRAVHL
jgi:hypothetical protein